MAPPEQGRAVTQLALAPSQHLEAEESIIGAVMLSPGAIEAAQEAGLTRDDFYRNGTLGLLFATACEMHDEKLPVDAITLADRLESRGQLGEVGGKQRVHELAALVPTSANTGHYARIVRQHAVLRRLEQTGQRIAALSKEPFTEVDELLAKAESFLSEAVAPTIGTGFESAADAAAETLLALAEAIKTGQPRYGLLTGFTDLDNSLTGFHPGNLLLLAARPGMGKSALAVNAADNIVAEGTPVGLLTLEMSKNEVTLRRLASLGGLDGKRLKIGKVSEEEKPKLRDAAKLIKARRHFFIEDNPATTPQKLKAEVRKLQRREKLGLLIVDYLQLMVSAHNEENRQQQIAAISRSLKLLARELSIPILALSQLNRNVEGRSDKRPMLADLRDSGALEQDADVVMFIYRDDQYNPASTDAGVAEIIVAKNRHGSADTVKLAFTQRTTTFKNLARGVNGT